MEYSVGSLADLISGANTANKPKVIKKEFKQKKYSKTAEKVLLRSKNELSRKKLKKKNQENNDEPPRLKMEKKESNSEGHKDINKQRKGKKRKLNIPHNTDFVDSDVEVSPKKKKLTSNEVNANGQIKDKNKPEELARTIFVGNVPINTSKKKIKKHFSVYGKIDSLRFRGIPVANPNISKKVAAIKKEFHSNRSNIYCYIRFYKKEDAIKAQVENGLLFEDHHLRVHICEDKDKPDESKAIFVGNLSFDAVEDELWKLFETCGPISYVRIIRDSLTGMGKGFAYVNFKDSDAVQLALEMDNVKLKDRELRISLCNTNGAKKKKKQKKLEKTDKVGKQKFKKPSSKVENGGGPQKQRTFQGAKFTDKKKKHKVNKGLLGKKKLSNKIAPKTS